MRAPRCPVIANHAQGDRWAFVPPPGPGRYLVALSGAPFVQEVAMAFDGAGQGPDTHNVAVDLDDLGHGASCALTDDQPGSFDHEAWVPGLVDERPRQPRLVLTVQVDHQVDLVKVCLCHGSVASLVV